jgi:Histidine kinase-like ATPase domain
VTEAAGIGDPSASISVPATPESLGLVRLFASAMGRQAALAEEDVEDLQLAMTEVCSAAIEASDGDGALTVEVGWAAGAQDVQVRVVASAMFSTGDPGSSDRARLLDALGLDIRVTDGGHAVAFGASSGTSR